MSSFSITVIGHWGAYPGAGEACSCYLLRAEGVSVLLDCGSGSLSLLQRIAPLWEIDAVVLSHYHADHVADLGCLQYAARIDMDLGRRTKPLEVFGHGEDRGSENLGYLEFAAGRVYNKDSKLQVGPFEFSFSPTIHPDPCYAAKVRCGGACLVYSGDTGFDPRLSEFARGADVFVCETSLYDEYRGRIPGHTCAGEAGAMAREAGVDVLVATHLPHFGEQERLAQQASAAFGGKTLLARPYLVLEV